MQRLPPHLAAARLIALEAEDHYLRVHTDAGSALILMRLSDAVQETGGEDGARCHRSWWVARHAVRSARRHGSVMRLHLDGGLEVPVSRSYLPALRSAGWI
jgi:DNA-binding LytR/AlgR family response regulator